jgi:hypothetical protein
MFKLDLKLPSIIKGNGIKHYFLGCNSTPVNKGMQLVSNCLGEFRLIH